MGGSSAVVAQCRQRLRQPLLLPLCRCHRIGLPFFLGRRCLHADRHVDILRTPRLGAFTWPLRLHSFHSRLCAHQRALCASKGRYEGHIL